MTDNDLIHLLCADLVPVRRTLIEEQLAAAAITGSAIAVSAVVLTLGIQPGLGTITAAMPLILKFSYTIALAGVGVAAALALARPGSGPVPVRGLIGVIVVLLALVAISQAGGKTPVEMLTVTMGASWPYCAMRIIAFSFPAFVGLMAFMRRQAPIKLRKAGASVGLIAGSASAAAYALACNESSASFVLVWYSLGIAAVTAMGALLGPRLLRW